MSWILYGQNKKKEPFPLEASSVKASARNALSSLISLQQAADREELFQSRVVARPSKAGLYLLFKDNGGKYPVLAGFWVVFGANYLEDGVQGAPDRDPPYAASLLEALTEEVWWTNLEVNRPNEAVQAWSPLMIFEWTSDLAVRSMLAPPGNPMSNKEYAEGTDADLSEESWLERWEDDEPEEESEEEEIPDGLWQQLPQYRSLIMIIRGHLEKTRIAHKGNFYMVHPENIGDPHSEEILSFPEWLDLVADIDDVPDSDYEDHFLGQPLRMPSEHVTFPVSGWLTRSLGIWPMSPKDIRRATLMPRDVGSRAWAQFKQAAGISAVVLMTIVMLSLIVKVVTMPVFQDTIPLKAVQPQPALSLCSADHEKFMEEFRCQIRKFVGNVDTNQPFCSDKGAQGAILPLSQDFADMQASYCGIRDRIKDGWVWDGYHFGKVAAAKACFNVLGHPWQYKAEKPIKTKGGKSLVMPNVQHFYQGSLSIKQLDDLVLTLDENCKKMNKRMEMQITGSIFATLIGSKEKGAPGKESYESFDLRQMLKNKALHGENSENKSCFNVGLDQNPYVSQHYNELCGQKFREQKENSWVKLKRSNDKLVALRNEKTCEPSSSTTQALRKANGCAVITRYERARFGNDGTDPKQLWDKKSVPDDLWQCHINLANRATRGKNNVAVSWDLKLGVPNTYNVAGSGVQHQLILDAGLRSLAGESSAAVQEELGPCWKVLAARLARYEPVHPLLAETDAGGWPSEEQQICGQICASFYRFRRLEERQGNEWKTWRKDLSMCMNGGKPSMRRGKGRFDKLQIPWNYDKDDNWVGVSSRYICAFNMVAQAFYPDNFLPGGLAPPVWAGDTDATSKIAGGKKAHAAVAAKNLSRYGRTRSRGTCGYAAAQCFASLMVDVTADRNTQPAGWQSRLSSRIKDVAREKPQSLPKKLPWCSLIHPYIGLGGDLPEGQLDYPCAKGVDEAQQNAVKAIEELAKAYGAE